MRRLGVVLVASLALTGSAAATSSPPFQGLHRLKSLPVIDLPRSGHGQDASCAAKGRQTKGVLARHARKLAPVACEQPPRSHVRDAGSVIVLAP